MLERSALASYPCRYVSDGAKPFRWLAPEALKKNRYSQHSDVWAFAVMCWELLTNGTVPYYEIVNDDAIAAHVTRGGRLELPSDCPAQLGTIITIGPSRSTAQSAGPLSNPEPLPVLCSKEQK